MSDNPYRSMSASQLARVRAEQLARAKETDRRFDYERKRFDAGQPSEHKKDWSTIPIDQIRQIPAAARSEGFLHDAFPRLEEPALMYFHPGYGPVAKTYEDTVNSIRGDAAVSDAAAFARAHAGMQPKVGKVGFDSYYPGDPLLSEYEISQIPPDRQQSGWGTPAMFLREEPKTLRQMAAEALAKIRGAIK